ncbi:SRFB1 protein, partial [Rhinopomastus cyanomelas]|nr:SRFB1 protein [Rhinopomastus cyanomelas]
QVVKMRKDVKKARVLTIRRLTRHIGKLKLKKGSEDLRLKNQKRVERLIEEIRAMKEVKPDEVTRLALRTEVNFESVCRKPNCTATERAIARLATHPVLKPRFVELKAAVKAFQDARKDPDKATPSKKTESKEQRRSVQHFNSDLNVQALKPAHKQERCGHKTKISMTTECDKMAKDLCENESEQKAVEMDSASAPEESFWPGEMKTVIQNKTKNKLGYQKKKENMSMNKLNAIKKRNSDDSDHKHPNEEEYFDDSTEERFYNQSSDSDSNSSDDFFIGKVKRKKKIATVPEVSSAKEKDGLRKNTEKEEKNSVYGAAQTLIVEEGKSREKSSKLESVFCSSLSSSNQKSQKRRNTKDQPLKNGRTALLKKEPQLKRKPFAKAAVFDSKKASAEQPLHPSWEASKRRREQISQITAFQGKKIKFDD